MNYMCIEYFAQQVCKTKTESRTSESCVQPSLPQISNGVDFGRRNHNTCLTLFISFFPLLQFIALDQLAPPHRDGWQPGNILHLSVDDVVDVCHGTRQL